MRIGEVAAAVGTTSRTIRYYEELGLLEGAGERESGKHRTYTEQDVERQLELVTARQKTLAAFAGELKTKLNSLKRRRRQLAAK